MSITESALRARLAALTSRDQKIVLGLFAVFIRQPQQVRDREWVAEQLAHLTLLAGDFEAASAMDGVEDVRSYLAQRGSDLVDVTTLLFARVGGELAPTLADGGFTAEDAMARALAYFVPAELSENSDDTTAVERDMGEQPLARLMQGKGLEARDLVRASEEQLTHKMVQRAMRGRRLTKNAMAKVLRAWQRASGTEAVRADLFDYEP